MSEKTTTNNVRQSKTEKASSKPNSLGLDSYDFEASASGHGVTPLARLSSPSAVPAPETRVAVVVTGNIIDTFEGKTETWTAWSETTNKSYVARLLATPAAKGHKSLSVLARVAMFLMNRKLADAIEAVVKVPLFMPKDTLCSKNELFKALFAASGDDMATAQVVMELICPKLIEAGFLVNSGRFATQTAYGFQRVEVQQLSVEIATIQAFGALERVSVAKLQPDRRQSKSAFAEMLAEMFRPVGLALAQVPELAVVLDDIVKCVRANLTPSGSVGSNQLSVSSYWASHPLIAELAQVLPFVRAALALPATEEIRISTESSILESWVKLVIEMIRGSDRYRWISRDENLRYYGVRKIRDIRGEPHSLIAYRDVAVEATAQSVIAVEHASLREAICVDASTDRLAENIKAVYANATFGTRQSADLLTHVAGQLTELGYEGWSGGLLIDAWGNGLSVSDLAVLASNKVFAAFDTDGSVITREDSDQFDPIWWFSVDTNERQLVVESGRHVGTEILTCDPIEALLAAEAFESKGTMPAPSQLLGPNAFAATMFNFTRESVLQPLDRRIKFTIILGDQPLEFALRAEDFRTLRALPLAQLVRPFFNAQVVKSHVEAYAVAVNMVSNARRSDEKEWNANTKPSDLVLSSLTQQCLVALLKLSWQIAPSFREDVQEAVISRVLASANAIGDRAQLMRAQMMQDYITARCDLIALAFFLHIQGMESEAWDELMASQEMDQVCLQFGSDRKTSYRRTR